MAEIRDPYAAKFGGKAGSRKTRLTVVVISAAIIAAGVLYFVPQYW